MTSWYEPTPARDLQLRLSLARALQRESKSTQRRSRLLELDEQQRQPNRPRQQQPAQLEPLPDLAERDHRNVQVHDELGDLQVEKADARRQQPRVEITGRLGLAFFAEMLRDARRARKQVEQFVLDGGVGGGVLLGRDAGQRVQLADDQDQFTDLVCEERSVRTVEGIHRRRSFFARLGAVKERLPW